MCSQLHRSIICTATAIVDVSRFSSMDRWQKTTAIVRSFNRRIRDSSTWNITANDSQIATGTLPGNLLKLYVLESCHHADPEYVKSFPQQRYFVFGVRAALLTIRYCWFQCRRFQAENVEPMRAHFPRCWFPFAETPNPFAETKVNWFAPIFFINGSRTKIFTCLVTQACRLEHSPALTSDFFIQKKTTTVDLFRKWENFVSDYHELH